MATLLEAMTAERERLTKAIADVDGKITALRADRDGYQLELAALDAYDKAKSGKRTPHSSSLSSRTSRQETIKTTLQDHPAGMTRGELLQFYSVKGNKAEEGSISNALTTMKKSGKITLTDGKYMLA
jgi:hypothetical protein